MTDNKSDQMRETSDSIFEVGISDIRKKKKTGLSATGANWYLCFQKDLKVGETANKVQERPTPSRANLKKWIRLVIGNTRRDSRTKPKGGKLWASRERRQRRRR